MTKSLPSPWVILGLLFLFSPLEAQYVFKTIDYPNSVPSYLQSVTGVSGNTIVGNFDSGLSGYREIGGVFSEFNDPVTSDLNIVTGISGSNIVGYYHSSSDNGFHGYLYDGKTFTTIDDPNEDPYAGDYVMGVSGTAIYGSYYDSTSASLSHSFIYSKGVFTPINEPNAASSGVYRGGTYAYGGSGATVVGAYYDGVIVNNHTYAKGFIYNGPLNPGEYTTITYPDALYTVATGVSGKTIVGYYADNNSIIHGFIYNPLAPSGSQYTTIDEPNVQTTGLAGIYPGTYIQGISGTTIYGYYTTSYPLSNGGYQVYYHGFIGTTVVSLVLHRVSSPSSVINGGSDSTSTATLIPTPSATSLSNDPVVPNGLVADGVTPLILELDANDGSTSPTNYTISMDPSTGLVGGQLASPLQFWLLSNGTWTPVTVGTNGTSIPISSSQPAFLYLQGLDAQSMSLISPINQLTVNLLVQKADGTGSPFALAPINIIDPPIVLVHGYNATQTSWTSDFIFELTQYRTPLVNAITYPNLPNLDSAKFSNTIGSLVDMATDLDATLSATNGVEDLGNGPFAGWAMTRYDLVCHSQGGVLARMLCTINPSNPSAQHTPFGTVPYRSPANFYRGRFRHIITIGSPHNGSRLLHYLDDLKTSLSPTYRVVPVILDKLGILQDKFDPFNRQIQDINNVSTRVVDSAAPFHLISTEIAGGQVPGTSVHPLCYSLAGLSTFELFSNYTYGQIAIGGSDGSSAFPDPDLQHGDGSDGVVDVVSQQAGPANASITTAFTAHDVAHADVPLKLFGVSAGFSDTSDPAIADEVIRELGTPGAVFGPFTLPTPLGYAAQTELDENIPQVNGDGIIVLALNPAAAKKPQILKPADANSTSYSLSLTLPANQPLQGNVSWYAEVFAPGGVTSNGLTLTVNANDSTQVTVTVDSSVVGDVVLYASYTSTNGTLVFAKPLLVVSIPSSATQTGISLSPSNPRVIVGESAQLELDKVYTDGTIQPAFLSDAAPAQFTSSDTSILAVDPDGTMHPLSPGQVTVTATYGGFTAQATVTAGAAAPAPQIISSPTAAGTLNTPFSYQITATSNPTSFTAAILPAGLSIDASTGLITGTPTAAGTFTVTTTASNGSLYTDTNTLTIVISSPATTFSQWESGFSFVGTPTATPKNDGVPNLLKYLYDINPSSPMTANGRAALPVLGTTSVSGTQYLTLTYRQYSLLDTSSVHIAVQTSTDLKTWSTDTTPADQPQPTGAVDSITGDPFMMAQVPVTAAKQFIRLQVTMP